MATTVKRLPCRTLTASEQLAELDATIAYYERCVDDASRFQVRRLRNIRRGMLHPDAPAVVTAACPGKLN
ncbi:hypothetical protein [Kribbella albertanoniae]|uniref:Uncharacterized protein n=1 Tax=Kribbella albertanoniae TaxID=1266829 RepID=A0A4R4PJN4_9ACTN|nr:hypothetical protein [Kribbella albertanoniae]TDC22138.1 hypothetical protein E1261_31610 [Kribbella albertanoniae]